MPFRSFIWKRDLLFGSALLLLVIYLIIGEKPWNLEAVEFTREVKEPVRTRAFKIDGLYWAAALNVILLAISWFVGAKWFPAPMEPKKLDSGPVTTINRKLIWGLVIAAAVFAGWQNNKRLDHSLWGDEESTTQKEILGTVYPTKDGESYRIVTPKWQKTLWNWDRGPGNQVAYSVAARLVHGDAEPAAPDDPHALHISERKLRTPAWIAGILSILAVGWMVWTIGFPIAAPAAAWLVALHPWFVRWASEARGYSFVMLLTPLAVVFLVKGVHSGRWKWWIALGITQFLLLWSHLGSLYFLVALNLGGGLYAYSVYSGIWKNRALWQLASATLLGAVLTLQMMGPLVKQLFVFVAKDPLSGELNGAWFADWASFYLTGSPYFEWNPENSFSETRSFTTIIVLGIVAILGAIELLRRPHQRWLLIVLLAPAPLFVIHATVSGSVIYPWYVVGFLPLFLPLTVMFRSVTRLSFAVVFYFAMFTHIQRKNFLYHPIEPLRESVALTREVTNPWHPDYGRDVLTLGFVHATRLYDPGMVYATNDDEALAALREAKISGKPLFVNAANLGLMDVHFPKMAELFADGHTFTLIEELPGQFLPATTRFVYRYTPES